MRRLFILALGLALGFASSSSAELSSPTERPILTVTGLIDVTNVDGRAVFDLSMLDAIAGREMIAETPWFDGEHSFQGALFSEVLKVVGARGDQMRVTALNGYQAVIPLEDVTTHPVILATRMDGEVMSIRENGPVFVVYPFDLSPDLYNEVYFGRSVWQVKTIEIF